jgi:YjbE family integral membrane protein
LDFNDTAFWLAIGQIIWINILLSGDNAVVIAMACRSLSDRARLWGMILGAGVAVVLRIIFTGIVTTLMNVPYLKAAGAIALLYIAIDLIKPKSHDEDDQVNAADTLLKAMMTIAIADVVMSLDNVVAIAAVAKGSWVLLVIGLGISIPMIVAGSAIIMAMLDRFPVLVWAGAALLGWIAGELFVSDVGIASQLGTATAHAYEKPAAIAGAVFVLAVGALLRFVRRRETPVTDQHQSQS